MSRALNALVIICLCLTVLSPFSPTQAGRPVEQGVWGKERETSLPATLQTRHSTPYVPGQVIVKLRGDAHLARGPHSRLSANRASLDSALAQVGARASSPVFLDAPGLSSIYRVTLDAGADVLAAVAALSADPDVEYAEPDYIAYSASVNPKGFQNPSGLPNDPLYGQQWGLTKIGAPGAWDVVTGTPSVIIAVVDSGIDLTHPDLAGQLWTNPGEIPGNGIDDDNNGYIDDVSGWNFVGGSNDISDGNGHGTQVAGVAAAATNNGAGIAGLCWNCRLMPVKVMADSGVSNYSDIAAGVAYAAQKGAKVINLSLGGYADSRALRDAIAAAVAAGAVVVAGAGNDNTSAPFYPAAYPNVLSVAGTTSADAKATYSNYGTWVSVSAPGEAITTTFLGGDYGPASGTSLAAPFAAGLAGLIRSLHPDWTEAMARNQILRTADGIDVVNPAYAGKLGAGRINAASAMQNPRPILTISSTTVNDDPLGRPTPGQAASLAVTLRNDWWDATGVTGTLRTSDAFVSITSDTASFGSIASGATGASNPSYSFTVASGAGYNHPIAFTLAITANADAYTTTLPLTVTTRSGDEPFCGTVTEDMTWTSDKTYIIGCNVGIAPGYTLTIQPGTQIKFNGNYALNVGGMLVTDGTEDQPIRFMSNYSGTWNRLYFDAGSTNAVVDADYGYISGSILRYVTVDKAASGIVCNSATPYLERVTLTGGGINCTPGTLVVGSLTLPGTALVFDSSIAGGLTVNGVANVWQNAITGSSVSINGQANALSNTVTGNLGVGAGSLLQGNTINGSINAGPLTNVIANSVTGGSINISNSAGEAEQLVVSNTIKGGGISVGLRAVVSGNDIQNASGWAINGSGIITVTGNRLASNASGINVSGGLVQGNLIANNAGIGLQIGSATVLSNTFTANGGSAIKITSGTPVEIAGNNFEFNTGQYDMEDTVPKASLMTVPAQRNWWGTTSGSAIGQRIYDFNDDYTLGTVLYSPVLTQPSADTPAYVRAITLTPASPVGIQSVAFDVLFSREMDTSGNPAAVFYTAKRSTWQTYNTSNSGLASIDVLAITVDAAGDKWFGTNVGGVSVLHTDGSWQTYNTSNSGLASNNVEAIVTDAAANKWFGTWGGGVNLLRADGSWQTYNELANNYVCAIVIDAAGNKWFGTAGGGVSVLRSDGSWQTYNTSNSGLASNAVRAIAVDAAGNKWFGIGSGVSVLRADGTWQTYVIGDVGAIAVDTAGNKWFGTRGSGVSVLRADGSWQAYNTSNSGLVSNRVSSIAIDDASNTWFGAFGGVSVLWGGTDYPITDNSQWLSPATRYRATYDFSTLIPRGAYSLTVSGARGMDGIEIASYSGVSFTVDYAGYINVTTPPPAPTVNACGASTADRLSARWNASDPNSAITLYRYAIGTTPGAADVVNWTDTPLTFTTRVSLTLTAGQTYYVSVKARNEGGLWSEAGVSSGVVAGSGGCPAAGFSASPTFGPAPLTVQFTDASSGNVTSRQWGFGDGSADTSLDPTHVYTAAGVYTVSLDVSGPGGSDSIMRGAYISVTTPVSVPAPVASFTASPRTGAPPLTVYFTDTSTGTVSSWLWQFGDGAMSATQNPSYTYNLTGTFDVTLTVTGPGGSSTRVEPSYIRVRYGPVANFSASPRSGSAPLNVQFTDLSNGATSWLWSFGDTFTSAQQHPAHTYTQVGTYTVSLDVSGPGGADSLTRPAYISVTAPVSTPAPVASFTASPRTGAPPLTVYFTDTSTGTVTSWLWQFGDGASSATQNPSHTYNLTGTFDVTLTVTGPGGSNTRVEPSYIRVRYGPVANFSASPRSGSAPLVVQFTDLSSGATSWLWNFGDTLTSSLQNPTHTYTLSGTYTVALQIAGPGGSDSLTKSSYIAVTAPEFKVYLPVVVKGQ